MPVELLTFALAAWLGAHLLARAPGKPAVRWAATGALGYALALAADAIAPGTLWPTGLFLVPLVAWPMVLLHLAGDVPAWQRRATITVAALGVVVAAATLGRPVAPLVAFTVLALLPPLTLALTVKRVRHKGARALTVTATILFALGMATPIYASGLLPSWLSLPLLGVDLVILAVAVVVSDAFEEGASLGPDLARSAVTAGLAALVFGGQAWLAMLATGRTAPMVALLFGVVGAAVAIQPLHAFLLRLVDRLTRTDAADLRDAVEAVARRPAEPAPAWDDAEFTRLVRRALRDYAHLGRLVASPLTTVPALGERLAARGAADGPLERAAELKSLLRDGVERLRPVPGEFGTSDEWRFFNAVHYPYVVGLRPYSVRARHDDLTPDAAAALKWFRAGVPERTLHNWQNRAAELVAAELRQSLAVLSAPVGSAESVRGSGS
ncbi:hypothetical protein Afil01_15710 [Actinorhabdospora filicis]|uniref:Uncharacterized protein n=1 Tax=Actinorhabdospora filicis TaxID=1785913 RepID=A0A9W6SJJ5_9ACTN|nr:hypothetical protein [Actinorhabdospora filicis]GLZ76764.1 hypothetical protein Afil01_15710 [Actinorhabdospora filicis]